MADATPTPTADGGTAPAASQAPRPRGKSHAQQMRELYALPAPIRTFPLPTFIPHNPLSLFHILYVWISQTIRYPSSHIDPVYQGWFSPETRSVHVTDVRAIRGLWEQGFYGKGTLSRSEPSWLGREKTRRGNKGATTSEENTRKRRAERQKTKWERARKEREAIDQTLLEEATSKLEEPIRTESEPDKVPSPSNVEETSEVALVPDESPQPRLQCDSPVGPLELLSLPISQLDLQTHLNGDLEMSTVECFADDFDEKFIGRFYAPPVGPLELLALPNSFNTYSRPTIPPADSIAPKATAEPLSNGNTNDFHSHILDFKYIAPNGAPNDHSKLDHAELVGGSDTNEDTVDESVHSEETAETSPTPPNEPALSNGSPSTPKMKRQKSVRFSPTVEKNTFLQSEPPSPERAAESLAITEEPLVIQDMEHLQLTLEETFFLSYALGAIAVVDPETQATITNKKLFTLCRQSSYFPPPANPTLSPDDPFMINYLVYHHFRSLGWVVRSGIKFSVDYMLYNRGPVFTHAEFAVLILPSYSDPYWKSDPFLETYSREKEQRSWAWMSCINRVITQVKKTLVLVYVDIPPPLDKDQEDKLGIDGVLGRYKVREFVMGRFVPNRMRSSKGKERVR